MGGFLEDAVIAVYVIDAAADGDVAGLVQALAVVIAALVLFAGIPAGLDGSVFGKEPGAFDDLDGLAGDRVGNGGVLVQGPGGVCDFAGRGFVKIKDAVYRYIAGPA